MNKVGERGADASKQSERTSELQAQIKCLQDGLAAAGRVEHHYELIAESAPNGIVVANRQGHIVFVNTETERMFGYPRKELLGHCVEVLIPRRFRGHHPARREEYYASPQARAMGAGRDLYGLRKDGSEFPVEIGLNPIEGGDGLLISSIVGDSSPTSERAKRTE